MKAETKESAAEKMKDIWAGVAKDKAAKVQDGKDRRRAGQGENPSSGEPEIHEKAGGRVSWKAPEEMVQVDYTSQEKDFAELVSGPDHSIYDHVPREARAHAGRDGTSAPVEAQELVRKAQALADGPVLGKLQEASDDLYAWASTRVANDPERLRGSDGRDGTVWAGRTGRRSSRAIDSPQRAPIVLPRPVAPLGWRPRIHPLASGVGELLPCHPFHQGTRLHS